MRVTQLEVGRNLISSMTYLANQVNEAARQMYSGAKLNSLADSPLGSSDLVNINEQSRRLDSYRFNIESGTFQLKSAESALNQANNTYTSIFTLCSQAVTETTAPDSRKAIALQVSKLREDMLSYANSEADGRYLFAGSKVDTKPYEINATTGRIEYKGDNYVNGIPVHEGVELSAGIPGPQAFEKVFANLDAMVAALDADDMVALNTAMEDYDAAMNELQQARGVIGTNLSLVDNFKTTLDSRELVLTEQKSIIADANLLEAATSLTQFMTAMNAAQLGGSAALKQSTLFDSIG